MKKIFIVTMTISCLFSLQNMKASFSDTTDDYIPTGATWGRASANTARKEAFAILQSNGDYQGLAELKRALASLDAQYNTVFKERLNTGDHDTFKSKKTLLDQQEAALLQDAIANSQPPAYENPPAYTEPTLPDYSEGDWNTLPVYEKEDWSDTGWVKVGDRDLAGFYDSPEYEQYLRDQYLND